MSRWVWESLAKLGINPRAFRALTKAFVLMDLRGQHYAKATGTRPRHVISPLFWVVGQCLTLSAVASLVLFMRVDVFFYSFVGLCVSTLVIATTVLVEFHEVVLQPDDLDVIGHRPVTPRTYSAARFANLLFYVALMYLALNLFPLIVGAGLRDAGPWYLPAYLAASLCANLTAVCLLILVLARLGTSRSLEQWKELFAWTQIVLILVFGYGAQFMWKDKAHGLELWAAFPPHWIQFLPTTWLARFVERATVAPDLQTLGVGCGLLAGTIIVCTLTVKNIAHRYREMQPVAYRARTIPMPGRRVGTLVRPMWSWFTPTREERIGFWIAWTSLKRDAGLRLRCMFPFNIPVAVIILGLLTGQFANPLIERSASLIILPILAVYSIALAVPQIAYQFTFTHDSEAGWLFATSPLDRPEGLARGVAKAVQAVVVTPLCIVFGIAAAVAWGDPISAVLHAGLAWLLSWPMALASLWLVVPDFPLRRPLARGGSLGPIALPLAAFSAAIMPLGALHYLFAGTVWYWIGAGAACVGSAALLGRRADERLRHLIRQIS